tara:strand:+ start:157 stop:345 length:189 start_codon:yes stop_codon:yes gene_type:complete
MEKLTNKELKHNLINGCVADVWHDDECILQVRVCELLEDQAKAICKMDGELFTFPIEVLSAR